MTRLSPFKLGLFVLVVGALGAVAVVWVGAARVFQSTRTYAAFFAQPVTGLQPGAAVEHLGVRIGRVDSVDLAPGDRVVQVVVELRSSFELDPAMALAMTQAGITGSPFLALDETPPQERREVPHPQVRHPVLPTRPGSGGLGGAVQGIEKKIASIDLQGLLSAWESVARDADGVLRRGDLPELLADARASSAGLRRIAGAGSRGEPSPLERIVRELETTTRTLEAATASVASQVEAVRPGTAQVIASRIEATADAGEKAVRNLDANVETSLGLVRENLAQLKRAVAEAEALARSLRAEPNRVLERGGGSDPFGR